MTALLLAAVLSQAVPARVAVLEATIDKKRVGEVTFLKHYLPGKGIERVTTFKVDEDEDSYVIIEKRLFDAKGEPISIERSYEEDGVILKVTVSFKDNVADVTFSQGSDRQTTSVALIEEDASTLAVSETWFINVTPKRNDKAEFWEYDIDASNWVNRVVKYHGLTELKVGDKFIKAHRISVGDQIDLYVDDFGMPYRLSDKSVKGGLVLTRILPKDGGGL